MLLQARPMEEHLGVDSSQIVRSPGKLFALRALDWGFPFRPPLCLVKPASDVVVSAAALRGPSISLGAEHVLANNPGLRCDFGCFWSVGVLEVLRGKTSTIDFRWPRPFGVV